MFVGRDAELRQLETFYRNPMHLKVVRVEGRPGSGKSALCRRFVEDKPSVSIWDASPTDNAKNLLKAGIATQALLRACEGERLPVIRIPDEGFKSWGRFFCALCAVTAATARRVTLVLDGYAALCSADPSFAAALESAVDALWATHLFVLITGEHDALGACPTPARLDPLLAQTTNVVQLRGLGLRAADLGEPATPLERIAVYGAKGGLPGRYGAPGRSHGDKGVLTDGLSARESEVLHILAAGKCPVAGMTAGELAEELGIGRLEAMRVVKDLRRRGIVEGVPCFSFEGGAEHCEDRFRIGDPADIAELADGDSPQPLRDDLVFLDMGRAWLWEALRGGELPFEFERVGWWYADDEGPNAREPWGVIGVNGHYRRAVCVEVLDPKKVLSKAAIDELLDRASRLPYKNPHCAVLCVGPVAEDVLAYAAGVDTLVVAELRADGVHVVSAPWKAKSPRYRAAAAAASEGTPTP